MFRNYGRLTKPQIIFVTVLGSLGGIYIWKPAFEKYYLEQRELQKAKDAQVQPQA